MAIIMTLVIVVIHPMCKHDSSVWRFVSSSVLLIIPITVMTSSIPFACGMAVFGFYAKEGCDPLRAGQISNPNQVEHSLNKLDGCLVKGLL